jgi:hypothetical protein
LSRERLYHILTILLLVCGSGCRDEKKAGLEQLRKENPFAAEQKAPTGEILIVTCRSYPLQLPAYVNVGSLAGGPRFDGAGGGDPNQAAGAREGFPADQVQRWRENGLTVSVEPMSRWQDVWQSLTKAGAMAQQQTVTLIRNQNEVADIATFRVEDATSVFVREKGGKLRGYTVAMGNCLFRVGCVPRDREGKEGLHVTVTPIFAGAPQERLVRDESGRVGRVMETPTVAFEELGLSGPVAGNYFLCISGRSGAGRGSVGELFLTRREGGENLQVVLLLAPSAQKMTPTKTTIMKP